MKTQLHAGQLRYHDFSKLRELHSTKNVVGWNNKFVVQSFPTSWQNRNFLTLSKPEFLQHSQLKRLERIANSRPDDSNLQYEFVSELAKVDPNVVVERYSMNEYAMDERLAYLYLKAMQSTSNYASFNMEKFVNRLATSNPTLEQHISELLEKNKVLAKAGQVAALLGVLGNPTISGYIMSPGTAGTFARGIDPKSPLYVQLQGNSSSMQMKLIGMIGSVLTAFIIVSALSALVDEKGVGRAMGMGSSKHIQEAEGSKIKFSDVKGVSEAKAELEEIVQYLKDPSKFTRLGGRLPRGLLLTGPPGTGKTLLAKAIAGEADVPFFFASGSQFEEVYVGLGAKRVRELFEAAKKKAPAIIFIDEIDAVGGNRKLKDQSALKMTLNELLVQMDGFDENNGIIVIGATNFAESLDSALLRPGRFDKLVVVPLPDVGGRKEILELYAHKTKLAKDVDLDVVARGTTGFSGADLFNLMNQAALKASIDGLNAITMPVIEYAKDKIMMGSERKTAVITPKTAKCTAYHEAGHALVAVLTEGAMPVHKATIMPRGNALGMVMMLPEGDQTSQSYKEMIASMDVAMGGRVAEEIVFGGENVTSGAASDIQHATRIARAMVTKFGFSDSVGIVYHAGSVGEESASSETRKLIDAEVKNMTQASYNRAKELLLHHTEAHRLLAETLLEYESLTGDEVRDVVFKKKKPSRPVVNSHQGGRGDNSILTKKSPTPSTETPGTKIKGWGFGSRKDETN